MGTSDQEHDPVEDLARRRKLERLKALVGARVETAELDEDDDGVWSLLVMRLSSGECVAVVPFGDELGDTPGTLGVFGEAKNDEPDRPSPTVIAAQSCRAVCRKVGCRIPYIVVQRDCTIDNLLVAAMAASHALYL